MRKTCYRQCYWDVVAGGNRVMGVHNNGKNHYCAVLPDVAICIVGCEVGFVGDNEDQKMMDKVQ